MTSSFSFLQGWRMGFLTIGFVFDLPAMVSIIFELNFFPITTVKDIKHCEINYTYSNLKIEDDFLPRNMAFVRVLD